MEVEGKGVMVRMIIPAFVVSNILSHASFAGISGICKNERC